MFNTITADEAKAIAEFAYSKRENMAIAICKYPILLHTGLLDINRCYDFSIVALCDNDPSLCAYVDSVNQPRGRLRDKWRAIVARHLNQFESIAA